VMVLPKATDGWMSQLTMDVLRVRLIRQLQQHDKQNRLRVYYPEGPGLSDSPINVHAKIMIVDDTYATVGSANLNNRSMGLDTECNAIIDAHSNAEAQSGIANFRHRLLAEHLGCSMEKVQATLNQTNSLIACIDKLTNKEARYLNELSLDLSPDIDRMIPDTEVTDPEEPLEPDLIMKRILPAHQDKPARSRMISWLLLIAAISGLAAMWQWTPLNNWVNVDSVSELFNRVHEIPASPVWVVLVFILAGFIAFPLTILIVATVLVFGLIEGFIYSLIGGIFSSLIVYMIGEKMARKTVRRLAGSKLNNISEKLSQHGIITIVAVRIVPVAPFTIVNLVAGASHINFRDYTIGTLLGMAPGMFSVTLIADRAYATIKNPVTDNLVWLVLSVAVVAVAAYFLVNWSVKKARHSSD
ncbi:VTT domain-containing protein, partial [Kaarinaea lacus]